jgi:recombination protein RecR
LYQYPLKLQKLVNEISKLPGVGPKMAERAALYLVKKEPAYIDLLCESIDGVKNLSLCPECFSISEGGLCSICADEERDRSVICAVEMPEHIITVEKTGRFHGVYHVFHGLVNPLNNIMPENIKLTELAKRVEKKPGLKEIILAVNHSVEGDATALYAAAAIREKNSSIIIARLAKGLPTGSDINYADEVTLGQAIMERKKI